MHYVEIILLVGAAVIFYSYAGYGLILWIWYLVKKIFRQSQAAPDAPFQPPVTLIIPAYNEEAFIEEKILNSLALEYPEGHLKILVVTDGSTDKTLEIVARFPTVELLQSQERTGKVAAIDRAMKMVKTDFVIFSDANTYLNKDCLHHLMNHYRNPEIGGVAGEKKIIPTAGNIAGQGEGLYWQYESFLKKMDAEFYTVVGAAGELFSIRTSLYEYPGTDVLLDDFIISLKVCLKGYRVAYEPRSYAMEMPSLSIREEQKRKTRISAGAFQSIFRLPQLFNFFRHPRLSFQYISHRVLRWTLCPVFLVVIFLANVWLVYRRPDSLNITFLAIQSGFYLLALLGWITSSWKQRVRFLFIPYYFVFINFSLFAGFYQYIRGRQTVLWEKAKRHT